MYSGMSSDLSGCAKFTRLLFIIFNVPILVSVTYAPQLPQVIVACLVYRQLCGLASLAIGIWLVIVESRIEEVLTEVNARAGAALFITIGVLLASLSCVGFLGVCCKSRVLMLVVRK